MAAALELLIIPVLLTLVILISGALAGAGVSTAIVIGVIAVLLVGAIVGLATLEFRDDGEEEELEEERAARRARQELLDAESNGTYSVPSELLSEAGAESPPVSPLAGD